MNDSELKEKLKKAVIETISSSIDRSNIGSDLYREFYATCNEKAEKIKKENKLVIDALESITQVFGINYRSLYEIENKVTILKRTIIKMAETEQPKQRYLIFGYSDDYGHSHCSCVTSKDYKFVDEIIKMHGGDDSFEHIYYEDSKLLKAMSEKLSTDIEGLTNLDVSDMLKKVEEFFKIILADEVVSKEEFSEYLD